MKRDIPLKNTPLIFIIKTKTINCPSSFKYLEPVACKKDKEL